MIMVKGRTDITHHEVSNNHGEEKEGDTSPAGHPHAVPHGLDPLPAQHSEHDHERVHEVTVDNHHHHDHLFVVNSLTICHNLSLIHI